MVKSLHIPCRSTMARCFQRGRIKIQSNAKRGCISIRMYSWKWSRITFIQTHQNFGHGFEFSALSFLSIVSKFYCTEFVIGFLWPIPFKIHSQILSLCPWIWISPSCCSFYSPWSAIKELVLVSNRCKLPQIIQTLFHRVTSNCNLRIHAISCWCRC